MTESFESTNVLTRTASIHSSRHDPGAHIAESFQNGEVSKHCFSGGLLWDGVRKKWTRGGPQLEAILDNDDILDKTFGFKQHQWDNVLSAALTHYTPTLQPYQESVTAHQFLSRHQDHMESVNKITLKNGQEVHVDNFVAVSHIPPNGMRHCIDQSLNQTGIESPPQPTKIYWTHKINMVIAR
jgi:hypothetical protein